MIDIGYYNGTDSHHGLRLRCAGHIFAAPGRRIDRPAGREDWLLFYVAAGSETFFLPQGEQTAEAGDLILFAPGEPQRHVCRSTGTAPGAHSRGSSSACTRSAASAESRCF